MTDDEQIELTNEIAVDEDMDEQLEDMSLEGRKAALKQARWNVFLFLGVAAILFGFALSRIIWHGSGTGRIRISGFLKVWQ